MDYKLAEKVVKIMLNQAGEFDDLLLEIQDNCSEEEFKTYQKAFGRILGVMLLDVMNPVFKQYPELKPKELQ